MSREKVEYYIKNGKAYILVSPGFGSGWSTCNKPEIAYDRRVVEKYLEGVNDDEMEEFLYAIGYENTYMGGYSDIEVAKVPVGIAYVIHEYDGSESITTAQEMEIAGC